MTQVIRHFRQSLSFSSKVGVQAFSIRNGMSSIPVFLYSCILQTSRPLYIAAARPDPTRPDRPTKPWRHCHGC